jgi:hypothetical protein
MAAEMPAIASKHTSPETKKQVSYLQFYTMLKIKIDLFPIIFFDMHPVKP